MVRSRASRWWLLAAVVAVALALWQTAGAWGPGLVRGDDTTAQLVRNDYGLDLLARGRPDGWFPRFMLGHELFLFFGPGFTAVLGALKLVTFGVLSTAGAYKAAGVMGVAALGPAALFLARSLGLRRPEAAAGSLLVLAVNNPFGLGLHGTYVIGLVPHQVAASFFCLALGSLARMVEDRRRRWMVLGAGSLAAVALIHPITALVLAVLLAIALVLAAAQRTLDWPAVGRIVVTGAAAVGAVGFWAVPFLAHRDLQGPVTAWATPPLADRVGELVRGEILWTTPVFVLAAAGALATGVVWIVRGAPWLAFVAAGPAAYLGIAHAVAANVKGAVSLQLANRGLGYAGLIAMLGAGIAVGAFVRVLAGIDRRSAPAHSRRPRRGEGMVAVALSTLVAAAVVVLSTADDRALPATDDPPAPELRAVADILGRVVPDSGRFATERDFPGEIARTGTVHPDLWLAYASGRNTLNLFNPESSPTDAGFATERIGLASPAQSADVLSRFAVTHIVTVRPETSERYSRAREFVEVARYGELGVFALRDLPGRPPPEAMVSPAGPLGSLGGSIVSWTPERISVDVDAARATTATVALSWSPKWRATIDGRTVSLRPNDNGVVTVRLPAGRHRLVLRFGRDGWDWAGLGLSGVTLVAASGYGLGLLRRRRRGGTGAGQASAAS